jgi:hypothetical protein
MVPVAGRRSACSVMHAVLRGVHGVRGVQLRKGKTEFVLIAPNMVRGRLERLSALAFRIV